MEPLISKYSPFCIKTNVFRKFTWVINFHFSSAWISKNNICDYFENKVKLGGKNKTQIFKKAIEEIEEAITQSRANDISIDQKIDLKNVPISELLASFTEHETVLRAIFEHRRQEIDRFIFGNGYDFLTVLARTLTSSQQQAMYSKICASFMGDTQNYLQNPKVYIIYIKIVKCWI